MSPSPLSPKRSATPREMEIAPTADVIDLTLDSDDDDVSAILRTEFIDSTFVKNEPEEPVGLTDEIWEFRREAERVVAQSVEKEATGDSPGAFENSRATSRATPTEAGGHEDVATPVAAADDSAQEGVQEAAFIPPRPVAPLPMSREELIARDQQLDEMLRNGIGAFHASMNPNAPYSHPNTPSNIPQPPSGPQDQATPARTQTPIDSEAESAAAAAKFQKIMREYDRKKRNDDVDVEEEVEFKRAQEAEQVRIRLLERKRAYVEREDSIGQDNEKLFFSDVGSSAESPPPDVAPGPKPQAKKQRQDGATLIPAKQLQKSQQTGLDEAIAKARKRGRPKKDPKVKEPARKNDPTSRVSKPNEKKRTKSGGAGKGNKGGRPAKRPQLSNIASLLNNDIVRDVHANIGRDKQPGFTSKNKKEALTELMASIPEDHRKPYASDKKHLDDACKKFTYRGQGSMGSDGSG